MAKQIKQYRYFGEGDEKNSPANLAMLQLVAGTAFETQITDLRIQSYPGTKFYLNDADDWVMIGASGEYNLNLSGNYEITALRFDKEFLQTYFGTNGDGDPYLIIDIVYNSTEE